MKNVLGRLGASYDVKKLQRARKEFEEFPGEINKESEKRLHIRFICNNQLLTSHRPCHVKLDGYPFAVNLEWFVS